MVEEMTEIALGWEWACNEDSIKEVVGWLAENMKGNVSIVSTPTGDMENIIKLRFRCDEDAAFFKLKFLHYCNVNK